MSMRRVNIIQADRGRLFVVITVLLVAVVAAAVAAAAEEKSSVFPLGRSWAGDQELPLPLGIGATYFYQKQDYILKSLNVDPIPVPPDFEDNVQVQNSLHEINLKVDLWLIPFLNIFGIIGNLDGKTDVDLGPQFGQLEVDYDGLVYGGGLTAAGGYKSFFASLTAHFMSTNLEGDRSSVDAFLLTPKAGATFDRFAVWGGAMYQQAEEKHTGSIYVEPFGDVDYEVTLEEKNPWNFLIGGQFELAKHWILEAEGGFGERTHALVTFTYRR